MSGECVPRRPNARNLSVSRSLVAAASGRSCEKVFPCDQTSHARVSGPPSQVASRPRTDYNDGITRVTSASFAKDSNSLTVMVPITSLTDLASILAFSELAVGRTQRHALDAAVPELVPCPDMTLHQPPPLPQIPFDAQQRDDG